MQTRIPCHVRMAAVCLCATMVQGRAAVVVDRGALQENETFESDLHYTESQRVVELATAVELLGEVFAVEARVRWRVVNGGDSAILIGELIGGGAVLKRQPLSGRPWESHLELRGLRCKARLSDAVVVAFEPAVVQARTRLWKTALEGLRGSERGPVLERLWASLREALRLPLVVARHGERPQLPIALRFPLRNSAGKVSGVIFLEPVPRSVVGGSASQWLWTPLRGRVTTRPRPDRGRLTTLVQPHRALSRLRRAKTMSVETAGSLGRRRSSHGRPGALEYAAVSVLPTGLLDGLERTLPPFEHLHEVRFSYGDVSVAERAADGIAADRYARLLPFRAALGAKSQRVHEELESLSRRPAILGDVIDLYRGVEEAPQRDAELAALFHFVLAEELARLAFQEGQEAVRQLLDESLSTETSEAVFALCVRAAAHPYALLNDVERLTRLSRAARRNEWKLARWGVRALAAFPWQGALATLEGLRAGLSADHPLNREINRAVFRLSGPTARQRGTQREARSTVPYLAEEIVQHPIRESRRSTLGPALSALGFHRIAFGLDSSSAMSAPLPQAVALVAGSAIGDSVEAERLSRFAWSTGELAGTFESLTGKAEVGLAGFHTQAIVWGRGFAELTAERASAASRFVKALQPGPTSSLGAGFPPSLLSADPDCFVMIVSDGANVDTDLELRLALWNYLRGTAIVIVSFGARDTVHAPDETLGAAERISRREWGWHLRVSRR